ncbi:MAG: hypothetical protein FWD87_01775 [Spirochaetaceae bacterium]|nr:hypothetical protein [Spirochaetaceae bacterium]
MHPKKSRKPFTLFKKKTQSGIIWMAEKRLSGHRINCVYIGMRAAVRYAIARIEKHWRRNIAALSP